MTERKILDKEKYGLGSDAKRIDELRSLYETLREEVRKKWNRDLPLEELLSYDLLLEPLSKLLAEAKRRTACVLALTKGSPARGAVEQLSRNPYFDELAVLAQASEEAPVVAIDPLCDLLGRLRELLLAHVLHEVVHGPRPEPDPVGPRDPAGRQSRRRRQEDHRRSEETWLKLAWLWRWEPPSPLIFHTVTHILCRMKNVTLAVDENVLADVRRYAAANNTSVNALVRQALEVIAERSRRQQTEWDELFEAADQAGARVGEKTWSRDDLRER